MKNCKRKTKGELSVKVKQKKGGGEKVMTRGRRKESRRQREVKLMQKVGELK